MCAERRSKGPAVLGLISDEQTNSALQKSFAILEALVRSPAPLTPTELELLLQTPKTSIQRNLQQLEANGLAVRDATGKRFRAGGRLRSFAVDVLSASTRLSPSHLLLRDLVADIGESCNLGVLNGSRVVYIDRVECRWPLRSQLYPGATAPVHCTGIGKLLLAHLPERDRDRLVDALDLEKRTERTISSAGALRRHLAQIRDCGYAVNDQEHMVGMIALAVPVRDREGRILAGLAMEAPAPRLDLDGARRLIPKLARVAAEIGGVLLED